MPSRPSSLRSSRAALTPYFPQAEASASWLGPRQLPAQPRHEDLDSLETYNEPIHEFDEKLHDTVYTPRKDGSHADLPPPRPEGFSDPYLLPSLTRNERLRLTMLWYHTDGLLDDEDFLRRLQEQLDLVQAFMGWEYAIMGLVSENMFTRVATAGIPLALVPRRDSPCSHTINQKPGSVFMLPNMASDWRFKQMPCVEDGLRSYAGAQLRCKAPSGDVFALGSLCVASVSEHPPLTPAQQTALVRFADLLSADIINHSREKRRRQRHYMDQLLAERRTDDLDNNENRILDLIREVYPAASVGIHESFDGTLSLPNHTPIDIIDVTEGLWEDSEYIDELIRTQNNTKLESSRTVRAIIFPCQTYPSVRYLVVASNQVQVVFDDVDSCFVDKCAVSLAKVIQEASLRDALKAKDQFLRGVTHQLRTPIHGILGSCELLAEELANRKVLKDGPDAPGIPPSSIINTIRDSGRELMSTVNNMLKLNRFIHQAEIGLSRMTFGLQTLSHIEADILYEVHQAIPEHELSNIPIIFENRLSSDDSLTTMDVSLLKECIQSLILNALFYTKEGAVIIVITASPDRSRLTFDVLDTGCGIAKANQTRIFEPFEKVDAFSRGAGLGLTLAARIASLMGGNVTLVASSQDPNHHGSHFRAEFYRPSLACAIERTTPSEASLRHIPRTFHVIRAPGQRPELVTHFANNLEHRGFTQDDTPKASFVIVTYTPDAAAFQKLIKAVGPRQVAICLIPEGSSQHSQQYRDRVRFYSGPFISPRIQEILAEVDRAYQDLDNAVYSGHTATPRATDDDFCLISKLSLLPSPADIEPVALLVDDNVVNLRILRMYCEKRHIPYSTAVNGQEAVEQFNASVRTGRPINLILMDLQMPVLDGIGATQQIREIEMSSVPGLSPSHIFMITGQDSAEDKTRSFAAGADEFYVKPTGIRTLDRGIGKHFPKFAEEVDALKVTPTPKPSKSKLK
ncbi:Hybrid signal transduction histidine kinase J [Cytospora mali]|uniref:histidine kinase n=1 Tax=Cytospora mali TaxID=578113 RepID=A0A194ULN9_CYTMA|nr:Hybrid signal transduction histidine kinase J [Valsa mali var. pyri (nom. inval.)]